MKHLSSASADDTPALASQPRYLLVFIGSMVAIGALSLDAYLPAMPAMAADFGVGIVQINNTISVYLIGYGVGQFFGGALSDQIGRKPIGIFGLSTFTLASIAIAFAHTVDQVQWLRFVQAIGGGFSTVICMAIVRDVYPVNQLGRRMATVTLIMLVSPLVAPSLGAFLLRYGWHAIFVAKAVYSFMLLLYFALGISETRRGERSPVSLKTVVLQCAEVLSRKVNGVRLPVRYVFAVSCAIGVFMTYLTNSSFMFIEYFGVSETVFPVFFGINVVGMMAANVYSMRRLTAANAPRVFSLGMRVQIAAVSVLVSLVIFDLASLATLTPVMVVIVSTLGLIGPSGSSQYMSHFQKLAGSASSIYTTTLFSTGAVLGGISGYFFDGTLRPMVLTMLAATIIANLLAWSIRRARRTDVPPQRE